MAPENFRHITVTHQQDGDDEMPSYDRELGALTERIGAVEKQLQTVSSDVREVRDFMRDARASWKTLTFTGGIGGAIGAAAMKFFPFLFTIPK